MYKNIIKPILDWCGALVIFIMTSPIQIAVAIVLGFANEGKVLFKQTRPGKDGRLFTIYKFRTMADRYDTAGNLLDDSVRTTKIGKFLRTTSLDELPQLFNVLRGEMSFIGPRPLLPEYLERYSTHQNRRHEVKPGITGWAQCHGRNDTTWAQRLEHDVWYVDHCTAKTDLLVLLMTLKTVIKREGTITMEKFTGQTT